MTPSRQSTRSDRMWPVMFPAGEALTSTASPAFFMTWEGNPNLASFEHHVASLPTSQDLMAEARHEDPMFDRLLEKAKVRLHRNRVREVSRGHVSRLLVERLRRGLTQRELAMQAGMRQPNISRLEQVGEEMQPRTARRLAEVLGLRDYKVLLP